MKIKMLWGFVAAGACLALAGGAVQAAGDAEVGKALYNPCAGCHSISGYSNAFPTYPVPRLGGQNAEYLLAALKAYQSGERKHGSMEGNAKSMSDRDGENIVAFVSRLRLVNESTVVTGDAAAGKAKAASCAACHGGEDGKTLDPSYPRLTGQHEGYVFKVLKDYKSGARKNPLMAGIAAALSDQDMKDLSAYYASQKRGLTTHIE